MDYIQQTGEIIGHVDASFPSTNNRAATETVQLEGNGPFRLVVQKGRSFQRHNPHVRVAADHGRYLIVEMPAGTKINEEPGCFAIAAEGERLDLSLDHTAARSARADISALLPRITADGLKSKVVALASLHSRFSLLPKFEPALAIAKEWLTAAGCTVSRMSFPMTGGKSINVIGEKRGSAASRSLFIISAHLDSVNHDDGPDGAAPGADDNATGSATVAAIAQAVADQTLLHDVRFILFGGEEQGLFGSKALVSRLSAADRSRLKGVVNIDMAGSKNTQELSVLLEGAAVSQPVINALAQAAATYTSLTTQVSLNPFASDHVPFIQRGLPAVLTIEGADDAFPHEHTARDTADKINFDLHREITSMNLAWLLEQTLPN
jgi:Zn-dependent M28 family amino/carboxypeptidase